VRTLRDFQAIVQKMEKGGSIDDKDNKTNRDDLTYFCFSEQLRDLDQIAERIAALQSELQGITALVSSFLDLSSGLALQNLAKESGKESEGMRKLSERMHDLTKKSTEDAAAVKVLTILTLIYLPATVVSNFFSTSFVNSEPSSGSPAHIVISHDWWIFLAVSVPLTLVTLYIWLVWMRIQAYERYPWWWLGRRHAVSNGHTHTAGVWTYTEKV
jgi:Mg2+ and Co2+ transporter CorA